MEGDGNYPYNYGSSYSLGTTDQRGAAAAAYGANQQNFEVSEFFELGDWMEEDPTLMGSVGYAQSPHHDEVVIQSGGSSSQQQLENTAKSNLSLFAFCVIIV